MIGFIRFCFHDDFRFKGKAMAAAIQMRHSNAWKTRPVMNSGTAAQSDYAAGQC